MKCLAPSRWLNDEVLNSAFILLNQLGAALDLEHGSEFMKSVYFFRGGSLFYDKLVEGGVYSYERARSLGIFEKVPVSGGGRAATVIATKELLESCELAIVPVHVPGHWILILFDFKVTTIRLFDSLWTHNDKYKYHDKYKYPYNNK